MPNDYWASRFHFYLCSPFERVKLYASPKERFRQYFSMKEFNFIALLGFYLFCPKETSAQMPTEYLSLKVIEFSAHKFSYSTHFSSTYSLSQKQTLQKTADVVARTVEPEAAIIFSESKPIIQSGKRFVRPKIIGA
jgi:hypothetical protein